MTPTTLRLALAAAILSACPADDAPPVDADSSGSDTSSTGTAVTTAITTSADTTEGPATTTDPSTSGSSEGSDTSSDGTGEPPPAGGYGDCANDDLACLPDEACIFDGIRGVCSHLGCLAVTDCPPLLLDGPVPPLVPPAGVMCVDASGDGLGDCVIECSQGLTNACPEGMACVGAGNAAICMWPTDPPGGGQCPDIDLGNAAPQTYMGNNAGAGDDHFPLCSFASGEDTVVQWGPAPADGQYRFDTIGSAALPGGFDTTLAVLDSCPGSDAIEIGCGNDQSGTDSGVQIDLVEGQTVYLVVDSQWGDTGPFVLNIAAL